MGGQGGGWKGMGKRQRIEGGAAEEMVLHPSPEPSVPSSCSSAAGLWGWESPQALSHLNMAPHPLPLTGWFPWGSEPGLPLQAPPQSQAQWSREEPCLPPPPPNTPSDFLWVGGTHGQWLKTLRGSHFTGLTAPPLLRLSPGP